MSEGTLKPHHQRPAKQLKLLAREHSEEAANNATKDFRSAGYRTFIRKELSPMTGRPTGMWEAWIES